MEAEFKALGIDRSQRGKITDETLAYITACFDAEGDEVTTNGQTFLFRPRPQKPPIYVGGQAPHALRRATQFGDGWAVPSGAPDELRTPIAELHRLFGEAGKPAPEILVQIKTSPDELNDTGGLSDVADRIKALADVGVTRVSLGISYETVEEFRTITEQAAQLGAST
jgi:alkanesulfonate monooxygenase SsuD/methylene tetrahydromethanopterin reductase-like flavin-dependent oxidoreductase (luciferase family)